MIHQLDPHTPLVWRGPHSLQIGVSRDPRVLDDLSPTAERLIGALVAGASHARLNEIAKRTEDGQRSVATLLDAVRTHVRDPARVPVVFASVLDCADDLRHEASRLLTRGFVERAANSEPTGPGVMCAEFVPRPEQVSAWMSSGRVHAIVEFDDDGAQISTPVVPGVTPCGRCRYLARMDRDPAWAALASQLSSRDATRVPHALRVAAVLIATARIDDVLEPTTSDTHDAPTRFESDTRLSCDGRIRELAAARFHPRCGCRTPQ